MITEEVDMTKCISMKMKLINLIHTQIEGGIGMNTGTGDGRRVTEIQEVSQEGKEEEPVAGGTEEEEELGEGALTGME